MNPALKEKNPEYLKGLLFLMITWGLFFTWLWPRLFYYKDGNLMAGTVNIWGDFAVHLTYASNFAYNSLLNAIKTNPLLYGEPFTYPFVADAITGFMVKMGFDVVFSFVVTSILFTLFLLFGLYTFLFSQMKDKESANAGVTLVLLSGGMGFIYYLSDVFSRNTEIFYPNLEYTNLKEKGIFFINIVTSEFIPQRSILLGIPITLIILFLLDKFKKLDLDIKTFLNLFLLALLSVSLVFIHAHSFIVLFITCIVFLIYNYKQYKIILTYGIFTAILGFSIYQNVFSKSVSNNVSWLLGWYANKQEANINIIRFWLLNWGMFLPTAVLGTYFGKYYKNPFVISGFVLFVLSNLILFQAWAWDNTKVFTYSYIFLTIPVVYLVKKLITHSEALFKVIGIALFLVLISSGLLDVYRTTRVDKNSHVLHSKNNLEIAAKVNSLIDTGDIVLTGDNHNNPIINLTKAQALMGYRGWLWSYGLDYSEMERDINTMYRGGANAKQKLREYNVSYVLISDYEISNFKANQGFYESSFPKALEIGEYRLYKVK